MPSSAQQPSAQQQFANLVEFVNQLIDIHSKLQQGQGRRHRQEAIHHAGVVMMVAAWESYIEKALMGALDAIENEAGIVPGAAAEVAAVAAPPIPVPAWARLALELRRTEIANGVKRFHTPNADNVRDLLTRSLRFDPWAHWEWRRGPRQWDENEMRRRLNSWVQVRHSVAHGFPLPSNIPWLNDPHGRPRLTLTLLRECKKFFEHLVGCTDDAMAVHLHNHHGIPRPW